MNFSIQSLLSFLFDRLDTRFSFRRRDVRQRRSARCAIVESLEKRVLLTTLTVNSLADDVTGGDGLVTLREAIQAANTDGTTDLGETGSGADEIVFDPSLFTNPATIQLMAQTMGNRRLEITSHLTITGPGTTLLTIDGQGESQLFYVDSATVSITGMSLTGGSANGSDTNVGFIDTLLGGAIHNESGMLSLTNVIISGNAANNGGGGIYNRSGTLSVADSEISMNQALSDGGGIHISGEAIATILNSTIRGNTAGADGSASFADGGGIFNSGSSDLTITSTLIDQNSAFFEGGGIANGSGTASITQSTISNNTADFGGGIATNPIEATAETTITESTIVGNSATDSGAGVKNGSEFGNSTTNIANSTISQNLAGQDGGGIFNQDGFVTSVNVTIVANQAGANGFTASGGGIQTLSGSEAETFLANTIVAGNTIIGGESETPSDIGDGDPLEPSSPNNVIGDPNSADGLVNAVNGNILGQDDGVGGRTLLPLSSIVETTLADNGGPTTTHALVAGSPALNTGDSTEAIIVGMALTTDQRGFPRVVGSNVDIGAVEAVQATITANQVSLLEGHTGLTDFTFTVTLDATIPESTTVSFTVQGVAANADDFGGSFPMGTVTIAPNALSQTFTVQVSGDVIPELDEEFLVVLTNPSNGVLLATDTVSSTIENDEQLLVTSLGRGGSSLVTVQHLATKTVLGQFLAYDPEFLGGVHVAVGDFNGDNVEDVVTGPGPGGGPHVRVFDGLTLDGTVLPGLDFFAYDTNFLGGVFVAAADIGGPGNVPDGLADIVTGAGPAGGPHVKVLSGADASSELFSFFAFDAGYTGGVHVAAGDISGDGVADIITSTGIFHPPEVRVWDGSLPLAVSDATLISGPLGSFLAYDAEFIGGVWVGAGDIDGDGRIDIITGPGECGGPHTKVFGGAQQGLISEFFSYDENFFGGVRVAGGDVDGDGIADVITGAGIGGGPHLKGFAIDFTNVAPTVTMPLSEFVADGSFDGGIFVAASTVLESTITRNLRLTTGSTPSVDPPALMQDEANAVFEVAVERFVQEGLPSELGTLLSEVTVEVADLEDGILGTSVPGLIQLDVTAAGAGWFIDPTPHLDEEFSQGSSMMSPTGIDLLTVIWHELLHQLGEDDLPIAEPSEHILAATLAPGLRRIPDPKDLEHLFSDSQHIEDLLG